MVEEGMVLEIEGLEELLKALAKYPKQSDKMLKEALVPGLAMIASDAKKRAPVDFGRLMSSIGEKSDHVYRGELAPGILETKKVGSQIVGRVGSAVVYARAQEYGYPPRNLPAHPYMRPALKATKDKVVKLFEKSITKVLRKLGL